MVGRISTTILVTAFVTLAGWRAYPRFSSSGTFVGGWDSEAVEHWFDRRAGLIATSDHDGGLDNRLKELENGEYSRPSLG